MHDRPALSTNSNDPFQVLLALHERLNRELVAGVSVSREDVAEFFALASRVVPEIDSITEREEIRDLLRIWGSYLGAQGWAVPEFNVPERVPLMPDLLPEHHPDLRRRANEGVSLHIGVNLPRGLPAVRPLAYGEASAWRLAELANQAGYDSVSVLRGARATREAVRNALISAADSLVSGDSFFLSFTGFGLQSMDADLDERLGVDKGWCLANGVLMDDELSDSLRYFTPGVRILVVEEGCYRAGSARDGDDSSHTMPSYRPWGRRDPPSIVTSVAEPDLNSCIPLPPRHNDGIRASVLVLSGSQEDIWSRDGLFTRHLLDVWDDGSFRGSFCDLYRAVRERMLVEPRRQEPQLRMLGTADPAFPLEPAFHLNRRPSGRASVYR
jgi:metacaspase-1